MPTKKQLSKIFALAGDLGWSDEQVHVFIQRQYGALSLKTMPPEQIHDLIQRLEATLKGEMLTKLQNNKILALWNDHASNKSFQALSAWLQANFGVNNSKKLSKNRASQVIAALEKMFGV